MKSILIAGVILMPLAMMGSAVAGPCDGTVTAVGPIYIDDRDYLSGYGLWIYVESNGEAGLQRGGSNLLGEAEVCQESANPDLLIF